MWTKYVSIVSFVALLIAYVSALLVGWSWAGVVPGMDEQQQKDVLIYSGALAVVFWPLWFVHWRWARQAWLWESKIAQHYLLFFTAIGLGASVIVGVQLLIRVLSISVLEKGSYEESQSFLIGAGWSVGCSLWLWIVHGRTWRKKREETSAAK